MTVVRRFSPLSEALTLHDAMNQLFAQSYVQPTWSAGRSSSLAVPIDVFDKPACACLTTRNNTYLPSLHWDTPDLQDKWHSTVKREQQVTWLAQEIASCGSLQRSVTFTKPIDSERIETQYMNGLLMITVPL